MRLAAYRYEQQADGTEGQNRALFAELNHEGKNVCEHVLLPESTLRHWGRIASSGAEILSSNALVKGPVFVVRESRGLVR
jgi:hypothetical protein